MVEALDLLGLLLPDVYIVASTMLKRSPERPRILTIAHIMVVIANYLIMAMYAFQAQVGYFCATNRCDLGNAANKGLPTLAHFLMQRGSLIDDAHPHQHHPRRPIPLRLKLRIQDIVSALGTYRK